MHLLILRRLDIKSNFRFLANLMPLFLRHRPTFLAEFFMLSDLPCEAVPIFLYAHPFMANLSFLVAVSTLRIILGHANTSYRGAWKNLCGRRRMDSWQPSTQMGMWPNALTSMRT